MKKLVVATVLFFAFSANAQDVSVISYDEVEQDVNPANPNEADVDSLQDPVPVNDPSEIISFDAAANADIDALAQTVSISPELRNDLFNLMVLKHETLYNDALTEPEKSDIYVRFDGILKTVLDDTQKSQLLPHEDLVYRMSH